MSGNDKTKDIAQNPSKEETELDWEAPPEPPRPPRPDPRPALKSNEKSLSEAIDKLSQMAEQKGDASDDDDEDEDLDEDLDEDEGEDLGEEDEGEPDSCEDDSVPYELRSFKEHFKKGEGIKVKIVETDVQDSGSFPITWCLDKDVIRSHGYEKMWVLFSVFPPTVCGHVAEWRGYAKLKDMVGYITLMRPGHNRILVRLTWHREMVKRWMARRKGMWAYQTVLYPRDSLDIEEYNEGKWTFDCLSMRWADHTSYGCVRHCYFDYIDVDMPKECFAKEPSEAFKNWVNHFYRFKCVDECEFRRRALFAIFLQPFAIIFLILFRLLACMCLLFFAGLKGINWRSVIQPLTYSTNSIWEEVDGSHYYLKKLPTPFNIMMFFIPVVAVAGGIMWPILGAFGLMILKWIAISLIGVSAVFAIAIPLAPGIVEWFFGLVDKLNKWSNRRANEERERRLRELELLASCESANINRLDDVKHKTIRLRFQGIKSMVCKPFAR